MLALGMALIVDDAGKKTFEDLYERNKQKAFAVAFNILRDEPLAEDACSEAFLNIAKSFKKIHNLESHKLDRYVVITVRNTSLNLLKKEKENREVMVLNEETASDLSDSVLSKQDYRYVVDCIRQLSYTDQEILYLRVDLGLAYKDIAKVLHISAAAARQRFSHAKGNLARALNREGFYNE